MLWTHQNKVLADIKQSTNTLMTASDMKLQSYLLLVECLKWTIELKCYLIFFNSQHMKKILFDLKMLSHHLHLRPTFVSLIKKCICTKTHHKASSELQILLLYSYLEYSRMGYTAFHRG